MSSPDTRTPVSSRVRAALATEGPAAARIVVTVAASWQVALWIGAHQPPVYAAIVPLMALRGDPVTALATSLQRVLGVVGGVLIGITVLNVLHPSTAALALVVTLGLGTGILLRAGGPLNVQVPVSSLLVFASTTPDAYAFHRLWETGAGAGVTILLAPLLWPPDPRRTLVTLADSTRTHFTQALIGTAAVLGTDRDTARHNLTAVTDHIDAIHTHAVRAREAERAMRFNPLRRHHLDMVKALARAIAIADHLTSHLATLAREVAAFTGRADLAPTLNDAQRSLPDIATSTAQAITYLLGANDSRLALAAARDNLAAYARADRRPAAVALRRPFQQILDDLDGDLML